MAKHIIRCIRYILPLVVLLLIATYLVLSPAVFTHAAGATIEHVVPAVHLVKPCPSWFWRP